LLLWAGGFVGLCPSQSLSFSLQTCLCLTSHVLSLCPQTAQTTVQASAQTIVQAPAQTTVQAPAQMKKKPCQVQTVVSSLQGGGNQHIIW
jgi:hypothetical protein